MRFDGRSYMDGHCPPCVYNKKEGILMRVLPSGVIGWTYICRLCEGIQSE
jgi:hypothetical protein